jgi:hypothetical protein
MRPMMRGMATANTANTFKAQEVAYRTARGDWARRILKTRAAFERFAAKLEEDGREWYARDAEW